MARSPEDFNAARGTRPGQQPSQAMKDYEAQRKEARAKSEKLRAERLVREAANPPVATGKKATKPSAK